MSIIENVITGTVSKVRETTQPIGEKVGQHLDQSATYQSARNVAENVVEEATEHGSTLSRGARMVQHGSAKVLNDEARERTEKGNIPQTKPMNKEVRQQVTRSPAAKPATVAPMFGKDKRPGANIFKYKGGVFPDGQHGAGVPNFGMGQHPVNFGAGTAIPHGATGGSAVPTTGSALDLGRMGSGSIGGSLFAGSLDFTKGMVTKPIRVSTPKKKGKKK